MARSMTEFIRMNLLASLEPDLRKKTLLLFEETGYHRSDYDSEKPFAA